MNRFQQPRRRFLQFGAARNFTAFFASLSKISFAQSASDNSKGIVVHEGEGIHILTRRRVPITKKISKTKHGVDNI